MIFEIMNGKGKKLYRINCPLYQLPPSLDGEYLECKRYSALAKKARKCG
jgi:hypothetical protein